MTSHAIATDDEVTKPCAALPFEVTRPSSPNMVAHPVPVLPVVRKVTLRQRLATAMRRARVVVAEFILGDAAWQDRRVLSAAEAYFEAERVWDRSGEIVDLHGWKHAQRELEHAVHARRVARGTR